MKKQSPIIKILLFPINLLKYEVLGIYYTLYALLYPFIFIFNKIGDKAYSKYEENARKNSGVKEMVEEEVDRLMHRYEEQLKMQGISLDLYYQFTRTTEKDLRNQLEKEAYNNVLYRLMLEEIAKLEKIEVSDEETDKRASELAEKYKMKKDEFVEAFGGIEFIKYDLEMNKVIDLLKEENK